MEPSYSKTSNTEQKKERRGRNGRLELLLTDLRHCVLNSFLNIGANAGPHVRLNNHNKKNRLFIDAILHKFPSLPRQLHKQQERPSMMLLR